jgi:pantetheine-phosphate adenylyltransferase
MNRKVIYPGTFDPITNGHLDIIMRAHELFGQVEIVIAQNPRKTPLFTIEERKQHVLECVKGTQGITVATHVGLMVNYVKENEKALFVRGLRVMSDFEYEMQLTLTNRKLNSNIDTVFLMPTEKYIFLSSSMIRDIMQFHGKVKEFVPKPVYEAILRRENS